MHRQADNLARCARAVLDGTPDELDPLRAALLAYDAARQDTLRLTAGAVERTVTDLSARIRPTQGAITCDVAVTTARPFRETGDAEAIAVADLARRIAASVNLLAMVPLDSLERLYRMSDAPAVMAAKVRQVEGRA